MQHSQMRPLWIKPKSGELRGWSFGSKSIRDQWSTKPDGMQKRGVEEIRLFEVSKVLQIASGISRNEIEARGEEEVINETRIVEDSSEVINSAEINKTENSTEIKSKKKETFHSLITTSIYNLKKH